MASEVAFNIVKTVGALYLIYLGLSQWRAKVHISEQQQAAVVVPTVKKRFLTGFLTNATNPKGIIFMVAVLPQFITDKSPLLPQLLILAVTMCCIDLVHAALFPRRPRR
jgi:homoserine/homoserine lactone efflux protein